eukprot:SAG11_NODE_6798_length_1247_cov_1.339721_1_plen_59_part_00
MEVDVFGGGGSGCFGLPVDRADATGGADARGCRWRLGPVHAPGACLVWGVGQWQQLQQ